MTKTTKLDDIHVADPQKHKADQTHTTNVFLLTIILGAPLCALVLWLTS